MDPGDDFEVLRPFSSFSGEIWNLTLFLEFLRSGFPGMPRSKNSKFNCWPLHFSPRVVQRFSGPGEFRMPGPAGFKRAFCRILTFQNKLGSIREIRKKEKAGKKREMGVSRGGWAFVSAELMPGGLGRHWDWFWGLKPRKKNQKGRKRRKSRFSLPARW